MMTISDVSIAMTALASDSPCMPAGRVLFACGRIRGSEQQLWVAPPDGSRSAPTPESAAA